MTLTAAPSVTPAAVPEAPYRMADFWGLPAEVARQAILQATLETHAWHFARNPAYRRAVESHGAGPQAGADDRPRLLRPTAQTFKGYIDLVGPFPQQKPQPFLAWIADQLSIDLPRERFSGFKARYPSLEALLSDFERIYSDLGLEICTSSGTSGRSTIMLRSPLSMDRATEGFYLAFQRYFKMQIDHQAIFIMPQQTRIAMALMAGFSLVRLGIPAEHTHFTIPFPAYPDQVRIRAGRTYRPGTAGWIERRLLNPFMNTMNERYVTPRAVKDTLAILDGVEQRGEKVLVFGSWVHLHGLALALQAAGRKLHLAPGSLLGSGGGFKEQYPFSQPRIRADLNETVRLASGEAAPIRDVYGMSEANWVAMQCEQGNYHCPPWVLPGVLDEDGRFLSGLAVDGERPVSGLLAFFDPLGSGDLFPSFFRTADRVTIVPGGCACGEPGAYLLDRSVQRVDLLEEAGCAAQV